MHKPDLSTIPSTSKGNGHDTRAPWSDPEGWPPGGFGDPDVDPVAEAKHVDGGPLTPETIVNLFNDRYAVTVEGSKLWVVWFDRDADGKMRFRRVDKKHFYQMWDGYTLTVINQPSKKKTTRSWAHWWFTSPYRRQYLRGVTFDPSGRQEPDLLNLWRGWGTVPVAGDWSLMKDHLFRVICGENEEHYRYLFKWLARMVQHPELPGEIAIVMRGGKGIGKGIVGKWLTRLAGHHGRHISHAEHLVGRFNAHLRDCIFLFCDEAFFAGDKKHERVLKQLITEPIFTVEAKFQDAGTARNLLHIVMASNDDRLISASHDERRYFVLEVCDKYQGDASYFTAIEREMSHGGLEAMLWELQAVDLSAFNHRSPPGTEGLDEQKLRSFDTETSWLFAVLDRGYLWKSAHGLESFLRWEEKASSDLLRASYGQWCRENGKRFTLDDAPFGKFLAKFFQSGRLPAGAVLGEAPHDSQLGDVVIKSIGRPMGYQLGSLDDARLRFATRQRISVSTLGWDESETSDP